MVLVIKEAIQSNWTVLGLSGKLDVVTAPQLDETLNRLFHQGNLSIAIDLKELQYLSSSGIRILLGHYKKYKEAGRELVLMELPEHILEIIQLAGFNKVFRIVASLAELIH